MYCHHTQADRNTFPQTQVKQYESETDIKKQRELNQITINAFDVISSIQLSDGIAVCYSVVVIFIQHLNLVAYSMLPF